MEMNHIRAHTVTLRQLPEAEGVHTEAVLKEEAAVACSVTIVTRIPTKQLLLITTERTGLCENRAARLPECITACVTVDASRWL